MRNWRWVLHTFTALLYSRIQVAGGSMLDDWWHRVFGSNDVQPQPAALLEELQRLGFEVTGQFRGDDQGWFAAEIAFAAALPPLQIERYLSTEDDIRSELNTWTAWLETLEPDPHALRLMEQIIRTTQLFTLRQAVRVSAVGDAAGVNRAVCEFLARETAGVYHVDNHGFYGPDGTLLLRDAPV
jgi:hypothetical protein